MSAAQQAVEAVGRASLRRGGAVLRVDACMRPPPCLSHDLVNPGQSFHTDRANMGEVIIRRGTESDLAHVIALLDEVDELHRRALPWLFRQIDGANQTQFLEPYVAKVDHAMFLAVAADGALAGVLYLFLRQPARAPIVRPTLVAEIDTLVVKASCRRQGLGKRLVEAALAWANSLGATRTELGVYEFNEAARAFWTSVGFHTLSRRLVQHSETNG